MEKLDPKKIEADLDAALDGEDKNIVGSGGKEGGFHLSEHQKREKEIRRLQKRIQERRWNKDTNIRMVFPELGLDFRPANINKIISDAGFTPGTKDSHEFMEEWDRLQAEKIYEYYENKAKAVKDVTESEPTAAKPTSEITELAVDIFGPPVNPKDRTKDTTPERAIMWHALASPKLKKFSDLVGEGRKPTGTEEEKKLFNKKITELLDDFTTHGRLGDPDPGTGERELKFRSDLDGRACLILLKKAGFDTSNIKYVSQGESPESGWGFDISREHGYVIREDGKVLITNDSNKESGKDSSAKFLYDGLVKFGLLSETEALKKFVEFITKEDNKDYTDGEIGKIIENYSKNLISLQRYLDDDQLLKVFDDQTKRGRKFDPYGALPGVYLEKLSYRDNMDFEEVSRRLFDSRKHSLEAVKDLGKKGLTIDTGDDHYGKILIDTGRIGEKGNRIRKVSIGYEAARDAGYGGYVVWDGENGFFSIQTTRSMDFELPQGFEVSKRYKLYTGSEKLRVSLEEILGKLAGKPDYRMGESLKEALEKAREEREEQKVEWKEKDEKRKMFFKGAKIGEITKSILKDVSGLSDKEKDKIRKKAKILDEAKALIGRMAGMSFSKEDIEYFFEGVFSDEYFRYYKEKRNEVKDPKDIERFNKKFQSDLRKYLKEKDYNGDEAKILADFFGKLVELKIS